MFGIPDNISCIFKKWIGRIGLPGNNKRWLVYEANPTVNLAKSPKENHLSIQFEVQQKTFVRAQKDKQAS